MCDQALSATSHPTRKDVFGKEPLNFSSHNLSVATLIPCLHKHDRRRTMLLSQERDPLVDQKGAACRSLLQFVHKISLKTNVSKNRMIWFKMVSTRKDLRCVFGTHDENCLGLSNCVKWHCVTLCGSAWCLFVLEPKWRGATSASAQKGTGFDVSVLETMWTLPVTLRAALLRCERTAQHSYKM